MDLVIRNARLRGQEGLKDIGIKGERIVAVKDRIEENGEVEIDAAGNLVTPPFVDPHIHLDAVLTVGDPQYNMTGTLLEGIEIWSRRKAKLTFDDIKKRAIEAIKWEVAQGTTKIRTHVDVCDPSLVALEAMVEVKKEVQDIADLQIVAFPQEGIVSYPNGVELMRKALEKGADIVGGIPHYEWTREDGIKSLDIVFELAKEFDRDIDVHIDETDDDHSRFTEYLAAKTLRENYQGRVTASHTTAMHSYNNAYAFKLIGLLKRAEVNVITNPLDNIALQGRFDTYPKRRGLTRVKELLEAGVNVGIGHDSILDPWYPLGRGNMLQAAFMCLNVAHMTGYNEMLKIFDAITVNSARIFRLEDYGIEEGKRADLVVLNAPSEIEAIRLMAEALYVVKNGKIVAQTQPASATLKGEKITFRVPGIYD
ncbi:MAG TPA: cytosine deaminase [Thermotogae bacterium]|nr:cytosine deaminase [Thermotogota bacterium]